MNQDEMKKEIEYMADSDYEAFVKAFISFETDIRDQKQLDSLYQKYMAIDDLSLLNPFFEERAS